MLENQAYEDGQIPDRPAASREATANGNGDDGLWNERQDEQFYGQRNRDRESGSVGSGSGSGRGGGRWRYPANFQDADVEGAAMEYENERSRKKSGILGGKKKKDRWALSEDARRQVPDGEYVGDYAGGKKKKKKEPKVKRRKKGGDGVGNDDDPAVSSAYRLVYSLPSCFLSYLLAFNLLTIYPNLTGFARIPPQGAARTNQKNQKTPLEDCTVIDKHRHVPRRNRLKLSDERRLTRSCLVISSKALAQSKEARDTRQAPFKKCTVSGL